MARPARVRPTCSAARTKAGSAPTPDPQNTAIFIGLPSDSRQSYQSFCYGIALLWNRVARADIAVTELPECVTWVGRLLTIGTCERTGASGRHFGYAIRQR